MPQKAQIRLEKIPFVSNLIQLLKKTKLKTLEGLSFYDLIEMYFIGIVKGTVSMRASAISWSLFLALFPALIFMLNILPEIPIENFSEDFKSFLTDILPKGSADFFFESIYNDIDLKIGKKSWISTSFFLSIFLIGNGVSAIFSSFENSYHVQLTRSFFKQYLYAIGVGILLAFLFLATVATMLWFEIYIVERISDEIEARTSISHETSDIFGITIVKFVFFFLMTYLSTAILYFLGTAEGRKVNFFSLGALLTSVLYMLTFYLFSIYVENFSNYNELYGAIGGLLILMLYIWLNSNLLLLGFELNATLYRLRNRKGETDFKDRRNIEQQPKVDG